jgi:AmiR/NasT family two-component response regulator
LLTGMDDPSIIAEAREAGATAFLRKPADTARLCAVLASVLEPAPPA